MIEIKANGTPVRITSTEGIIELEGPNIRWKPRNGKKWVLDCRVHLLRVLGAAFPPVPIPRKRAVKKKARRAKK